jgi:hypothetical protein
MLARPLLVTGTGPVAATLDTRLNSLREKSFMSEEFSGPIQVDEL